MIEIDRLFEQPGFPTIIIGILFSKQINVEKTF